MKEITKGKTIILLIIFIAIGGIILYGGNTKNNFTLPAQAGPLDYVLKR
jgi:hypothetical protein